MEQSSKLMPRTPEGEILALFLASLAFILVSLFLCLSFPETRYIFFDTSKRVELTPNAPVTQVFTAEENGLERVKILMGDLHLGWNESVRFELKDPSCQETLRQDMRNWLSSEPRIFTNFDFEPIVESKGKEYCLTVTYRSLEKNRKDRPYIAATEGMSFAGRGYADAGKDRAYTNRVLQIRPAYGYPIITERFQVLENRLSQYKPAFMKGDILPLGILSCLSSIALAVLLLRKKD